MVWVGGFIVLVGCVVVALGIGSIVSRWRWVSRARKAGGTVIGHKAYGPSTHVRLIGFVAEDGRHLEMESNVKVRIYKGPNPLTDDRREEMAREIGEKVPIFYDPLNKHRAFVAGSSSGGVGLILFGLVWLAFGTVILKLAIEMPQ